MTQEEKDLLIRDLCARLPYGVKAHIRYWSNWDNQYNEGVYTVKTVDPSMCYLYASSEQYSTEGTVGWDCDFEIKPYLFPMSSMTEEQKKKLQHTIIDVNLKALTDEISSEFMAVYEMDFYNKNHIDYRGLIPKGLALDATGLNIY